MTEPTPSGATAPIVVAINAVRRCGETLELATALAASINAKRKEHYAKIAAQEGIDTAVVAARAGAKLRERAEPGHYVMNPDGSWTQLK